MKFLGEKFRELSEILLDYILCESDSLLSIKTSEFLDSFNSNFWNRPIYSKTIFKTAQEINRTISFRRV